ncbi:hypothetical protein [Cohnella panacarvi]|nr:hypothetical protein [Cohnella panacarvi]
MSIIDQLTELKEHEETIIWVKGEPFIVTRATDGDIERVTKGICLD